MYQGTMIDELIASVERAEEHARLEAGQPRVSSIELGTAYRMEAHHSDELVGVA